MCKNIQPFVLKSGNSINDQPYDNGPNAKLNYIYNVAKSVWMLKYGEKKFSPHHMKSVLVEPWDSLNMSAGNVIRDRFEKKKLLPLSPTNLTTNTQVYDASTQVPHFRLN